MITYYSEHTIDGIEDFDCWGGASTVREDVVKHPEALAYANQLLEGLDEFGETLTETAVNDFVWFDLLDELACEGYYDPDTDTYPRDEDEDED